MKLDPRQYDEMVSRASPPSPVVRDCAWAFLVGGAICTLGEALRQFFLIWYDKTLAGTLTSIALIFLSAIFTLPGWYQKLAAKAGGSGAGCSAAVLCGKILPMLAAGQLRRVLFLATGALMSQTTFLQGESIPGIAHCVELGGAV